MSLSTPHVLGVSLAGLILAALVGVVLGLGGYTFVYAEGLSYFSPDPKACVNCHIMRDQYDGWQKASHHIAATCNDCHIPHDFVGKYTVKARNGFWHSYYFTFQNFHEPIQISAGNAAVLQENCITCHASLTYDIRTLGSAGEPSNNCVRCHASVGHGSPR
jgi:cytochrome c nitrite reductase small subunit